MLECKFGDWKPSFKLSFWKSGSNGARFPVHRHAQKQSRAHKQEASNPIRCWLQKRRSKVRLVDMHCIY